MFPLEDVLEVEFKFVPDQPESTIVAEQAALFGADYGYVKWPPCVNFDIYLDTPDLALHHAGTPLRLRRWGTPFKVKAGVSSNFKYPREPGEGLHRRELKTILSEQDAAEVCAGAIIGDSLEHAAKMAGIEPDGPVRFAPQLMISTYCSIYVLRRRSAPPASELLRGKEADLLLLSFEHCAIQSIPAHNVARLVRNGMYDLDPARPVAELFEAELEIVATPENFATAARLYSAAFHAVRDSGAEMPERSKYTAAVQAVLAQKARDARQ